MRQKALALACGLAWGFIGMTTTVFGQTPVELLGNGGFEAGHAVAPWVTSSKSGKGIITGGQGTANAPHAGNRLCKLGGSNNEVDTLTQTVLIPVEATQTTLSFWYKVKSTGNGETASDFLTVTLVDSEGTVESTPEVFSNRSNASEWTYFQALLPAFGGYLLDLTFTATTDTSQPTAFFLDDVSFKYSTVPGTTGSPEIKIISPKTGCIQPLPRDEFLVVGGSTTVSAVGASPAGVASISISVDGKVVAENHGENRLDAILGDAALSPGTHDVQAEVTDLAGETIRCPVILPSANILMAGDFEGDAAAYFWNQSGAGSLLMKDAAQARSFDGFARLGGERGISQILSTYLPIAQDAEGIVTLSFFYRIASGKTLSRVEDTLTVQLMDLAAGGITVLKTLSNLSAMDGWALCRIPLTVGAEVCAGSEYELQFAAATNNQQEVTTFDLDDVGVWVRSQGMIYDPGGTQDPDLDEGTDELAPVIDLITPNADPPWCSGQAGVDECIHVDIRITGTNLPDQVNDQNMGKLVKFRVKRGGASTKRYAFATITETGPGFIKATVPQNPYVMAYPDYAPWFDEARVKVRKTTSSSWGAIPYTLAKDANGAGLYETGFRYGYSDKPVFYGVAYPAGEPPGARIVAPPTTLTFTTTNLHVFKYTNRSGVVKRLWPAIYVSRQDSAYYENAYPDGNWTLKNSTMDLPVENLRHDSANPQSSVFIGELSTKGSPSLCWGLANQCVKWKIPDPGPLAPAGSYRPPLVKAFNPSLSLNNAASDVETRFPWLIGERRGGNSKPGDAFVFFQSPPTEFQAVERVYWEQGSCMRIPIDASAPTLTERRAQAASQPVYFRRVLGVGLVGIDGRGRPLQNLQPKEPGTAANTTEVTGTYDPDHLPGQGCNKPWVLTVDETNDITPQWLFQYLCDPAIPRLCNFCNYPSPCPPQM